MNVAASTLASQVGIVCGWDETDCTSGPSEHVGSGVGESLKSIGGEVVLVVDDVVVRRPRSSLETSMCLKEEVEVVNGRDASIDNGTRARIAIPIRTRRVSGIETRVMTLAGDALQHPGVRYALMSPNLKGSPR